MAQDSSRPLPAQRPEPQIDPNCVSGCQGQWGPQLWATLHDEPCTLSNMLLTTETRSCKVNQHETGNMHLHDSWTIWSLERKSSRRMKAPAFAAGWCNARGQKRKRSSAAGAESEVGSKPVMMRQGQVSHVWVCNNGINWDALREPVFKI